MTTTIEYEGLLDEEIIKVTVSEGETYTSSLSEVYSVTCLNGENVDGYINAVVTNNRTITFHVTAGSDKLVHVIIRGLK